MVDFLVGDFMEVKPAWNCAVCYPEGVMISLSFFACCKI